MICRLTHSPASRLPHALSFPFPDSPISRRTLYIIVLAFAACVMMTSPARSESDSSSSTVPLQVRLIQFKGVQAVSAGDLKKILVTRQKRFAWFTKAPLDEKVLEEDLQRIEKYYQSQGFYHARVVSRRIVPMVGRDVRIEIQVEEGPPMMVKQMELKVDGELSGPWHQDFLSLIPLHEAQRFTTPGYNGIEKAILMHLANWGYPKARVELRARLDKRSNEAFIFADISRGQVCYFGCILIEGNEGVEDNVIFRELTFNTGDRYSGARIQESQQKLFDLDLFQVVDITVQDLDGDGSTLPVRVLVKEAKKQTVRAGVGYGTEDEFRGQIQWEIRDFLGDGRRLQVNAKASSLVQFLETTLLQPYAFDPKSSASFTGGVRHENQESFENLKFYASPVLNYKWSEKVKSYVGYNLEANHLLEVDVLAADLGPADEENEEYYISSLLEGVTLENVDSQLDPRKGWRFIENLEWASIGMGSEVDFVKLTLEARGYMPVSKFGVLAGKLKWGGIQQIERTSYIPIFKRFFAGGTDSVRGYPYQRLGPLDKNGNPIGGMTLVESSVEWRFPIRKPIEGVVFMDMGNVYEQSYELMLDALRYSAGCGLRYLSLVGPLRLDFGYQLNPPKGEFFDPYEIHFSIGQAF